ncbi:tetratricopeptide repeat protein [Falsiroseomonas ponticola]|uniref:tetratricopeptide repeat protein n=1 Tax=Falsiroseomonas ponticola TaxID=2786951 RepID=UPI001931788E|nr:tetratricopeptide repeat protein [Roseomonas ponticola]
MRPLSPASPRRLGRLARILLLALPCVVTVAGCARLPNPLAARPQAAAVPAPRPLDQLRAAAQASPDDRIAQARLADAAEAAGLHAEASAALQRVIELDGTSPERLVRLGSMHLRAGNLAAAEAAFTSARALSPRHAGAHAGLALTFDMLGDTARAQEAYRQARIVAPNDWTIRSNQAVSLLLAKRLAEAERTLAPAEREADAPQRARHNLALILAARGEHARVVRLLRRDAAGTDAEALALEFRSFAEWLATAPEAEASALLLQPATLRAIPREGGAGN